MSRLMSALSSSSSSSLSTAARSVSSDEDSRTSTPLSYSRSLSPTPPSSPDVTTHAEKDSLIGFKHHDTSMPLPSHLAASLPPTVSFDDDPSWIPHPADPWSLKHSEFGHCDNQRFRATSVHTPGVSLVPVEEEPSYFIYLATYYSYIFLILVGHMRDFMGKRFHSKQYEHLKAHDGYAPLTADFDSFFTRRIKQRFDDCFSRPITSVPSRTATLLDRDGSKTGFASFDFSGETTQALNVSSYNYLGFAQSRGGCADAAEETVRDYGVASCGNREDVGGSDLHVRAEKMVARFLGTEDAMIVAMGFATNSTSLPAMVSRGSLIISDELNHSSIRFGARLSGAMVKQYKHNDMVALEALLRECVSQGQPGKRKAWDKILVVVEGLYSMEGTLVNLPVILELKQKYKFYLYVDEAHSIGALGPNGRGVCDYFGVNPHDIDILMGTFTKSFGAAGGYVGGSHALISNLRKRSPGAVYGESTAPPVLAQLISSMSIILGDPVDIRSSAVSRSSVESNTISKNGLDAGGVGTERLRRLAFNSRYLRLSLKAMGFIVFGHRDSPIVPLLIYQPGKLATFSRLMLERHMIVVVVVGYPATSLLEGRARFCVSAAHTKDDLDRLLYACDDVGSMLGLRLSTGPHRSAKTVIENELGLSLC